MKKLKPESRKLYRDTIKWHNEKFDKLCGIKKVKGKLKLFTPEAKETINLKPEITYKMKKVLNSVKKAILHLNILGLLFIVACGSDNPVNNGNTPPTPSNDSLIFSLDSFNLSGLGTLEKDTIFNFSDTLFDSLKCTFDVVSNCDTTDFSILNVSFGNAGLLFYYRDFNQSYTLYASKNDSFYFALYSRIYSIQTKYLYVKNIKLYLR